MKKNKKSILWTIIALLVTYALVMGLTYLNVFGRYETGILVMVCINVILVVSLNVTTGFLGQLTLGHAGFMAVGAYTAAYCTKELFTSLPSSLGFILALILAGFVALILGIVIGVPTLRLKGDYLAIITLAFGEVIKTVLTNLQVVGGARGYTGIARLTTFSWSFGVMALTIIVIMLLMKSRQGRAIISVREDEIAAEASGIATSNYKILAFVLAAFFAGVAGGLYAHAIGILQPSTFDFNKSIEILVMVVLGGMGNIPGAILSAIALTVLPELLRGASSYRTLVYALVLIGVMLIKNSPSIQYRINKLKRKEKNS
ncbi:MAG: branched-chain amino acid ABC transporter permease [Anaerorhabdus sp.]